MLELALAEQAMGATFLLQLDTYCGDAPEITS